jgi:hypothetical protein
MVLLTAVTFWFSERLRDAALWPINLVRDLPLRSGRLLRTIWQGVQGLVQFAPEVVSAIRKKELGNWLRVLPGRLARWLHLLLVGLFDLVGGPEIAQFLMHLITHTTPLTADEIAAMASVLGPTALRYGDIRVAAGGLFDWIFKWNGNLAFTTWRTMNFPRNGRHTRTNISIIIHELAHVYQYEQVGSRYLGEAIYMLIKTKRDCYNYDGESGLKIAHKANKNFLIYNREQQAQIIQDYYMRQQKGLDTQIYDPFIQDARKGRL